MISIHAPAKGATLTPNPALPNCMNFNPRSREGSDALHVYILPTEGYISIHAPAKGATKYVLLHDIFHQRFQSTLPRRERLCSPISFHSKLQNFNPRSREGSDVGQVIFINEDLYISIHAPAKGATWYPDLFVDIYKDFNPRSREGSDVRHKTAY